jgi:hypothetical protein
MTQLREIAYLELDTFSLAGTGNINANFSQWTYKNIDLKAVLGPMWDKYNKFIIKLQQINTNGTLTYTNSSSGSFSYNLAGLDWINLYYEAGQSSQRFAPVANIQIPSSTSNNMFILPNPGVGFNFRKGAQIVDLEFRIYQVISNNFNVITTDTYNNNQMTFTIEPAEDNENEMGAMILNTLSTIPTPGRIITDNGNVYTYYNFNIKDVCREFWDKYEDFEIIYSSYTSTSIGAAPTAIQVEQPVAVKGFQYLNNYMGTGFGNYQTDTTVLAINKYAGGSSHTFDYMMPARVQFKKSADTMVLELQWKNFNNNGINTFSTTGNRRIQSSFFIKPIRKDLGCCDKGTLILSGAGMTTTPANFGVTNAGNTNTTWTNINLRNACRGFWDKYNKFTIFLNQCVCNPTNTNATQQTLMLYMNGLDFETPWTNDISIGSQTWTIGGVLFGHTISAVPVIRGVTNGNTRGIMFNKTSDIVDINMFVNTINGTALTATGALNGTYIFTIVPVEEE